MVDSTMASSNSSTTGGGGAASGGSNAASSSDSSGSVQQPYKVWYDPEQPPTPFKSRCQQQLDVVLAHPKLKAMLKRIARVQQVCGAPSLSRLILKLIDSFTNSHVEALVCLFLWTLCAHVCIHYVRVSENASPRWAASKQFVRLQCECSHLHHHPPTAVVAGKSKARAFFTAPPAKVSICEEHFRDNVDELREAVQHELTHAYDVWLPRSNW